MNNKTEIEMNNSPRIYFFISRKTILILLFSCFASALNAQIVSTPDSNFKSYLVGSILINTNGDNEIQLSEANSFTETILYSNRQITDLKGVEAITLCDTTINFDGVSDNATGLGGAATWSAYIYFNEDELRFFRNGLDLNAINFKIQDAAFDSIGVAVYGNTTITANGEASSVMTLVSLLYNSTLLPSAITLNDFTIHELPTPITLDSTIGYAIEITLYQNEPGFLMSLQSGDAVRGKSQWASINGSPITQLWSNSPTIEGNWSIRAFVSGEEFFPPFDTKLINAKINPYDYEQIPLTQIGSLGYSFSSDIINTYYLN